VNCIVTAGPTYESLDAVRRLTNFSTGRLGAELADWLTAKGHDVTLFKGYYAVYAGPSRAGKVIPFTTTEDLSERLHVFSAQRVDALFHAAAVSDFRFGKFFTRSASGQLTEISAGKFSTRDGPLLAELVPTPKIISKMRHWFPHAQLVGWKYEVDGTRQQALEAGLKQIRTCATNVCVVNGPAYGEGFGIRWDTGEQIHVSKAVDLFEVLLARIERAGTAS
jgi:phosphopantothenoylcysteine synthetase/decarboxylase